MPKGPQLSGDQYQGGVSNDDLLAGEQYMKERRRLNDDEINEAAKPKTRSRLPGPEAPASGLSRPPVFK